MPCAHTSGVKPALSCPALFPQWRSLPVCPQSCSGVDWGLSRQQSGAPAWRASGEGVTVLRPLLGATQRAEAGEGKQPCFSFSVDLWPLALQWNCGDILFCGTRLASMACCLGLSSEMGTKSLEFVRFQYQNGAWGRGLASHLMRRWPHSAEGPATAGEERSCFLLSEGGQETVVSHS